MQEEDAITPKTRTAGQLVFILAFLGVSVLLFLLIDVETEWKTRTKTVAQPRFWPLIALFMMTLFPALHLWRMKTRTFHRRDREELLLWLRPLEYMLWFMVYVVIVPVAGFLPATMVFAPLLAFRAGYRSRFMLFMAFAAGVTIVLIFKSMLGVKIPSPPWYDLLPQPWRSFFILNF